MTYRTRALSSIVALAMLAACGGSGTADDTVVDSTTVPAADRLSVAVALFPIEDIVRGVGGDTVEIVRLVEPGMPAHDAELTASQLKSLSASDAVFFLGENFQPSVEKAIAQLPATVKAVDLYSVDGVTHLETGDTKKTSDHGDDHGSHGAEDHDEHNHGDEDPHVWLDPANMEAMARAVSSTLSTLVPDAADVIAANTTAYLAQLSSLGDEIETAFDTCASRTLVTAHDAFGHFARRARITTAPITGINPQDQPSAKELEAIADVARDAKVSTVFFETALPDNLSVTVADAIGASVDVLDPVETVTADALSSGSTYTSIMRDNIARMAKGLGCT